MTRGFLAVCLLAGSPHDSRIAARCDRIVEMVDGKIRSDRRQSEAVPP